MKRFLALVLAAALSCMPLPAFATRGSAAPDGNPVVGSGEYARAVEDLLQAGDYAEGRVLARVTGEFAPVAAYSGDAAWSASDLYSYAPDPAVPAARSRSAAPADRVVLIESAAISTEELLRSLADVPGVLLAEPDYLCHLEEPPAAAASVPVPVPAAASAARSAPAAARTQAATDDPLLERQWHLASAGDLPGAANVRELWDRVGIPGRELREAVVAVIDSGVDYTHPDLAGAMWENPGTDGLPGRYGYDFVDQDPDPMDEGFHGTHVAGIIAAGVDNAIGGAGVAPNAKIMALRVVGDGGVSTSAAIGANGYVKRAAQSGVRVVAANNSWGGEMASTLLNSVIDDLYRSEGVVSFCSSGNAASDLDLSLVTPASLPSEGIIAVNAVDDQGVLADFSNWGAAGTDLAAPGVDILSTVPSASMGIAAPEIGDTIVAKEGFESDPGLFSLATGGTATARAELVEGEGAGAEPSGRSVRWTIEDAHEGQVAELVFSAAPGAAAQALAPGKTFDDVRYLALDAKMVDSSRSGSGCFPRVYAASVDKERPWIEITPEDLFFVPYGRWGTPAAPLSDEQRRMVDWDNLSFKLVCTLIAFDEGQTLEIGIDNVSLVEASPYGIYPGTSLSTPVVTGAYALIAGLFPDEGCDGWRARILGGVARSEGLSGTCTTDGALDIVRAVSDPYPVVDALEAASDGSLSATVRGSWFGSGGRVLLDGEELAVSSWGPREIEVVLPASLSSQKRFVQVERSDGQTGRRSVLVATGEERALYESLPVPPLDELGLRAASQTYPWRLAAAGGRLYATADLERVDGTGFFGLLAFDPLGRTWAVDETVAGAVQSEFLMASHNDILYVLETDPFRLHRYDPAARTLFDPVDCDAALRALGYGGSFAGGASLACDGRFLWIAGNADEGGGALAQAARVDVETGQVTGLPPLEHARCAPATCVVGGEVLAAAGDEGWVAGNLVGGIERLQGDAWATVPLPPQIAPHQSGSAALAVLPAGATIAGISAPYERMLLAGLTTADLSGGDTYVYDPVADAWQAVPERLSATKLSLLGGAVLGDAFYVLGADIATQQTVFRRLPFALAPGGGEGGGQAPAPSALAPTGDPAAATALVLALAAAAAAAACACKRRDRGLCKAGKGR